MEPQSNNKIKRDLMSDSDDKKRFGRVWIWGTKIQRCVPPSFVLGRAASAPGRAEPDEVIAYRALRPGALDSAAALSQIKAVGWRSRRGNPESGRVIFARELLKMSPDKAIEKNWACQYSWYDATSARLGF